MNGLIRKLILNGFVIVPFLLWFSDASFGIAIVTSLAFSVLSYLIGDQMLLRITKNTTATLMDALFAVAFFWMAAWITNWTLNFVEIASLAILLGSVEWMLHRYLKKKDSPNRIM
ncbi:DUF2512 family protein [Ammoniphilus sp. CFH 90114]|uniref:DUF2512 family protein n=1 Tax=Ammoniphilus sp. CFH 90114 TaxID=2493665 RepID=UPI00100DABF0|nr:DUF2512 family protein [Ammoniphilus sp. CFH 90114]RXT15355.1 DUF2512 family protein [Ammoniphilus sp. CFH 90114]